MSGFFDLAACKGMNPDLFFPEHGVRPTQARKTCETCPVRQQCLDYALADAQLIGMWGGTTSRQRATIRRQRSGRNVGQQPQPIRHGTNSGYQQHTRRGERPCPECHQAHTADRQARKIAARDRDNGAAA